MITFLIQTFVWIFLSQSHAQNVDTKSIQIDPSTVINTQPAPVLNTNAPALAPNIPSSPPLEVIENSKGTSTTETAAEISVSPSKNTTQQNSQSEIQIQKLETPPHFHEAIRRIVLFPFETQGNYKKEADIAWWKLRDQLSEQQRFMVATKRFLVQKEAFQPRSQLKIPDVILLSQVLETDCLISTFLDGRNLNMIAYSGSDGLPLWSKSLSFNSGKPASQQLEELSEKLILDFLATIPYHGFQIIDPLIGKPILEEGSSLIAKIDVGAKSNIQKGEKIQWIQIERTGTAALFQGGSKYTIYAEGIAVSNENQVLTVEIKRFTNLDLLQKKSLILGTDETKRLLSQYQIKDSSKPEAPVPLITGELRNLKDHNSEKKSLLTALIAIANIVAVILLAF